MAIGLVVLGHWLVASLRYTDGRFHADDVLGEVGWARWVTLAFQVIPVFFLVGGYGNATSWARYRPADWDVWLRHRVTGLVVPTSAYVLVAVAAVAVCRALGVDAGTLDLGGWAVALHLWFLPTYLLVAALTPVLHAAHRRWGLAVPAVLGAAAVVVDLAVVRWQVPLVGWANYVLVWGAVHQLGFAWQDGSFTGRPRLLLGSAAGLAMWLVAVFVVGFPISMVGVPGARLQNTAPPSIALLGFAVAQSALVIATAPALGRWLSRQGMARPLARSGRPVLLVYLWHMAPVIPVAIALYPTGLVPIPPLGSLPWVGVRFASAALTAVPLAGLVAVLGALRRLPWRVAAVRSAGHTPADRRVARLLLMAAIAAVSFALDRLAVEGFAPDGRFPLTALLCYAAGVALLAAATRTAPDGPPNGMA